ncbi:hypothetical protein B3286c1_0050 [Brucella vulpis]|uniref:hypothetical protein n=1 Tax=Brucella vulpis TaxID=981386 RepID=UPI00073ABF50|nr:hypothetical protein BF3285c1_0052 [Brucella vulpis]CUW48889.1 hypothetical protein B3286c1_0050 [Brucella vulpis]
MKNPSIFGSSQKRGVLIPICSRFESVTFRESEAILTLPEVCQQSEQCSLSYIATYNGITTYIAAYNWAVTHVATYNWAAAYVTTYNGASIVVRIV